MLTNNLKISDTTKREHLFMIYFQNNKKIRQKYCLSDVSSVLEPLTS